MNGGPAEMFSEAGPIAESGATAVDPVAQVDANSESTGGLDRRSLLKGIGAGLIGASLAPVLAACGSSSTTSTKAPIGAAPAGGTPVIKVSQGASLSILLWSHFVPPFDTFFDQFAADWGKANNVKVVVDHVAVDDIPARLAAEVAARKGHDLFGFAGQVKTRVYEKHLVDVSDLVNNLTKLNGDVIPVGKTLGLVNGAWRVVPDFLILQPPLIRTDLLKKYNLKAPTTWQEVITVGKTLKAGGNPCGMAISHCNDANHNWRTVMWSFGAHEVAEDGKTITVDSNEMREFLTWAKQYQADAANPEVYAWDNASDNRSLASGQAGFIHDAISGLRTIQPDNPELYKNIDILSELGGTKNRFHMADANMWGIWNFTPKANLEAATAFLWYYSTHQKETNKASTGYNHPFFEKQFEKPMVAIGEDPKYNVLQDYKGDLLQTYGWPGPPNGAAEQALAQFIIPDMVAKATQGNIEDAIKFGKDQLNQIYSKAKSS
jgi:multiple sugar transport system substrate-binding protein